MKHIIYIAVVLFVVSCGKTDRSDTLDKERVIEDIRSMLSDYHRDIAKEGLTAEFRYLDHSSDFFWVPPGYKTALVYDSVRNILENNAKSLQLAEFDWDTLQIFPLTNAIANYSGVVNGRMIDTAGVETKMLIIESGTIIKREDGWKLLSGQSAIINNRDQKQE